MENQAVDAVNLVQNGAYDLSIFSLFLRADPIVKFVMIGLLLSSVWSWAIIINKIKLIRKINNVTKKFEDLFWSTSSLEDLYSKTESNNSNPMIAIFNKSMIEWLKLRNSKIPRSSITNRGETCRNLRRCFSKIGRRHALHHVSSARNRACSDSNKCAQAAISCGRIGNQRSAHHLSKS